MIVKYNERSLKYFKALFAAIFNQKRKKMHYLQTEGLAVTSCVIRSAIGHFRVPKHLTFKTRLSAKPVL